MNNEKICDKCFRQIKNKDDYFMVVTYLSGKEIKKGYMHKSCNDEMEHQKKKMMNMVNNLGSMLPGIFNELGIETKKVISV